MLLSVKKEKSYKVKGKIGHKKSWSSACDKTAFAARTFSCSRSISKNTLVSTKSLIFLNFLTQRFCVGVLPRYIGFANL